MTQGQELIYFLAAFAGAMLWYRFLFAIMPGYFLKPALQTLFRTVRWHHWHHGVILLLVANVVIIFQGKNLAVIILSGLGLGLVADTFIYGLVFRADRELELAMYRKTLVPTLILFGSIAAAFGIFSLFANK